MTDMDGVACALEWSRDQEVTYWRINPVDWQRLNPLRPNPDPDLLPTGVVQGEPRLGPPLWPATDDGARLRALYENGGERALAEAW